MFWKFLSCGSKSTPTLPTTPQQSIEDGATDTATTPEVHPLFGSWRLLENQPYGQCILNELIVTYGPEWFMLTAEQSDQINALENAANAVEIRVNGNTDLMLNISQQLSGYIEAWTVRNQGQPEIDVFNSENGTLGAIE